MASFGDMDDVAFEQGVAELLAVDGLDSVAVEDKSLWGFKVNVRAKALSEAGLEVLASLNPIAWEKFEALAVTGWNTQADRLLVRVVSDCANRENWQAGNKIKLADFKPKPNEVAVLALPNHSEERTMARMVARLAVLRRLNEMINDAIMPAVDLSDLQSTMPGRLLSSCRDLVFGNTKRTLWDKVMRETEHDGRETLTLSRGLAMSLEARGGVDHDGTKSMFGQGCHLVAKWKPSTLRSSGRCFVAVFKGESAEDAGGVYREALDNMVTELSGPHVPVLIQCPNGVSGIGEYRDTWVVSPALHTPVHYKMCRFMGQIMGIALRTQLPIKLTLAPVVWKKLVGQEVSMRDLKQFDLSAAQSVEQLNDLDAIGVTRDVFDDVFEDFFVTHNSANEEVELIPGGATAPLTYDNCSEFASCVAEARLHEADRQIAAIKQGLATVVPVDLLQLWSWDDLEVAVTGSSKMDIELLKKHTSYSSCSESDDHVKFFWEALESFSEEDKSLFLRFVWGRSRLPNNDAGFKEPFKLCPMSRGGNPDVMLPMAHTCFFQLDLPAYTSVDACHDKMMYAVQNCRAMDGDDNYSTGRHNREMGFDLEEPESSQM
jgi:E3 ubiquitin-protein ligase HERC2